MLREPPLRGVEPGGVPGDALRQRVALRGKRLDGLPGRGDGGFQLLQADQSFEVGKHGSGDKKAPRGRGLVFGGARRFRRPRGNGGGPTRIRTWDRPVMSRRL